MAKIVQSSFRAGFSLKSVTGIINTQQWNTRRFTDIGIQARVTTITKMRSCPSPQQWNYKIRHASRLRHV